MPDTATPQSATLRRMLGLSVQCPTCRHGALKSDADLERGYCDYCHLQRGTEYDYWADERHGAMRSEAAEYYDTDGVMDDD